MKELLMELKNLILHWFHPHDWVTTEKREIHDPDTRGIVACVFIQVCSKCKKIRKTHIRW